MKFSLSTTLMAAALAMTLGAGQAQAAAIIDFSTGLAGPGGLLERSGTDLRGTSIPIGATTIIGAPANNGVHVTSAVLDFATGGVFGSNFIRVTGTIPTLGITTSTILLNGTIAGYDIANVLQGLVSAHGPDVKDRTLLEAVGLPANIPFYLFGQSYVANGWTLNTQTGFYEGTAISTDIKNSEVPEPTSMFLLGSGLFGLARSVRRRSKK